MPLIDAVWDARADSVNAELEAKRAAAEARYQQYLAKEEARKKRVAKTAKRMAKTSAQNDYYNQYK